ncbi:MAG: DNA-binding protein [Nitrospirales bacterium]|nr:MAG: DNA-binding protein [Nitrospirales bacterium]
MPKVNHEILKWARTTAGLDEDQAAKKLGMKDTKKGSAVEKLAALETGDISPTRAQLVKMSKHYRRPLLTFYLSDKPRIGNRGQDYRTLPEAVEITQEALVDVVIRDIRARQALVRNVLEDEDEAAKLPFISSLKMSDGVNTAITSLKKHLKWKLNDYRNQPDIDKAFAFLRGKAEEAGVFVLLIDNLGSYHTRIEVEAFRGFALADDVAPFVAINANDTKGAWCFTLLHELVHIWLGATGVSGNSGNYGEQEIEKFCNDVASEFLVPMQEIQQLEINNKTDFQTAKELIKQFALRCKVSNAMVAYKLCRMNFITYDRFKEFKAAFRADYLKWKETQKAKAKEKEGGPSYYVTKKHRVGNGLINLVARMMQGGAITTTKAGRVLGVRPQNVPGVIENSRPQVLQNFV